MNKNFISELPAEFEGRGQQFRGFIFRQLLKNRKAYLYEVTDSETGMVHYEVFKRKIRRSENRVLYPKSENFGKWAWCFRSRKQAEEKFVAVSV